MRVRPLEVIAGSLDKPLIIGDVRIPCFVLSSGQRVISQQGLRNALGFARGGRSKPTWDENLDSDSGFPNILGGSEEDDVNLPSFIYANWLRPYISDEILGGMKNRIPFNYRGLSYGYPAEILADLCQAIVEADRAGKTTSRQNGIVERAYLLQSGFSRIGIIGLVDEATGYQSVRKEQALADILERFIANDLQKWNKTFPDEYYEEIYRLHKWDYPPPGKNFPQFLGHYTNDIVYCRLAPGVLDALRDKNPMKPTGNRAVRHHQYLTPEHGHPKLQEHLISIIALMKSSNTWDGFKRKLNRVHPIIGTTMELPFEEFDEE